jgi:hypothetical protein
MVAPFKPAGESCGSAEYALFQTSQIGDPRNGYCILADNDKGLIENIAHFNWRNGTIDNSQIKKKLLWLVILLIVFAVLLFVMSIIMIVLKNNGYLKNEDEDGDVKDATGGGVFTDYSHIIPMGFSALCGGGAALIWFLAYNKIDDEPDV